MSKLKEYLIYELTRDPKEKKTTLPAIAGRALAGFFLLMLMLSIISRAADSITVAKIETGSVQSCELMFKVEGTGTIEENAEKYLSPYAGVRIESIHVKAGQSVKEGDILFGYDLNDLQAKLDDFTQELEKAKIVYERDKLSFEAATAKSSARAAEIILERTKLDYQLASEDLSDAMDQIKKEKEAAYNNALELLNDQNDSYGELLEQRDRALKAAKDEIAEAENARNDLYETKTKAEAVLIDYQTAINSSGAPASDISSNQSPTTSGQSSTNYFGDFYNTVNKINTGFYSLLGNVINDPATTTASYIDSSEDNKEQEEIAADPLLTATTNIFIQYYGQTQYDAHLQEVADAKKALERAKEDVTITYATSIEISAALTSSQKSTLIRAYQDAYDRLTALTKKDIELTTAITAYGDAIKSKKEAEITFCQNALLSLIYVEDDTTIKAVEAAEKTISKAQEALEDVTKEWGETLQREDEKLTKAQADLDEKKITYEQTQNNTYDYSTEVKSETRQLEAAQRAIDDAKSSLTEAKENDKDIKSNEQKSEKIDNLNLELSLINIQNIEKDMDQLEGILQNDGNVVSPVSGAILQLGVSVGSQTTGGEVISIAVDSYGFKAQVTKEDAKRLNTGDEALVHIGNNQDLLSVFLESISTENTEGMVEITGILPQGDYTVGSNVSFSVTKSSRLYQQTIPIQALRRDYNGSYYVLTTTERNSILGNTLVATRWEVNLIDMDYTKAAIENGPDSSIDIIVNSSKDIESGARVRLEEDND